jgi:hypothetical protein
MRLTYGHHDWNVNLDNLFSRFNFEAEIDTDLGGLEEVSVEFVAGRLSASGRQPNPAERVAIE